MDAQRRHRHDAAAGVRLVIDPLPDHARDRSETTVDLQTLHWALTANSRLLDTWHAHPATATPLGHILDRAVVAARQSGTGIRLSGVCPRTGIGVQLRIRPQRREAVATIAAHSAADRCYATARDVPRAGWRHVIARLVSITEDLEVYLDAEGPSSTG